MKHSRFRKYTTRRRHFLQLLRASLVLALALCIPACNSDLNTLDGCIPNATSACTCDTTGPGMQICQSDGTYGPCVCDGSCIEGTVETCYCLGSLVSGLQTCTDGVFEPCQCPSPPLCKPNAPCGGPTIDPCHALPGASPTCGDGIVQAGEECDDQNCSNADGCNNKCLFPKCGNGIVEPPEMCDGDPGCQIDCTLPCSCASSPGKFVAFGPDGNGALAFGGQTGLDAFIAACQALGAEGPCTYSNWNEIEINPMKHQNEITQLLASIPDGTCKTVWLERGVDLPNCPHGPGGNCNNWETPAADFDGETVDICNVAGTIQFNYALDCDPAVDFANPSAHDAPGLECSRHLIYACCDQKFP